MLACAAGLAILFIGLIVCIVVVLKNLKKLEDYNG